MAGRRTGAWVLAVLLLAAGAAVDGTRVPAASAVGPVHVYGHRGSGLAPANTLPAFRDGLARGASGIELDVHATRDGALAVIHDFVVPDGPCAGPFVGRRVEDLTLVELQSSDCGGADSARPGQSVVPGTPVPTLGAALGYLAATGAPIQVDVKRSSGDRSAKWYVDAVVAAAARAGVLDRLFVISWDRDVAAAAARSVRVGRDRAGLVTGALGDPYRAAADVGVGTVAVQSTSKALTADRIARAHAARIRTVVWTVDEGPRALALVRAGVDAVTSDRPDVVVRALRTAGLTVRRVPVVPPPPPVALVPYWPAKPPARLVVKRRPHAVVVRVRSLQPADHLVVRAWARASAADGCAGGVAARPGARSLRLRVPARARVVAVCIANPLGASAATVRRARR